MLPTFLEVMNGCLTMMMSAAVPRGSLTTDSSNFLDVQTDNSRVPMANALGNLRVEKKFQDLGFIFRFSLDHRCDQIVHCDDKSDEGGCSLLVLEDSYNKEIPPILIDEQNKLVPVQVKVSTSFKSVLDISESSHTIDLKLGIKLEWYEGRAKYHNLKRDTSSNVLSNSEV